MGSVVLLKEDSPRGVWKMGKIVELMSSSDGKFRAAKVFLPTKKVLKRPLNLLYPLECESEEPRVGSVAPRKRVLKRPLNLLYPLECESEEPRVGSVVLLKEDLPTWGLENGKNCRTDVKQ